MPQPIGKSNINLPALSTEEMREVDRLMMEEYQVDLLQMMENAGSNLAELASELFFKGEPREKRFLILSGSGGNGGGGMAAARHLHNRGADVEVLLTRSPENLVGVPARQLAVLQKIGIPVKEAPTDLDVLPPADLVVDALIGYSLKGAPTGSAARLIQLANAHNAPILSLDTPSGVDSTTGQVYIPHIQAQATMTLALPKQGLLHAAARHTVGDLYLADIGVPPELYKRMGLDVGPIFYRESILKLS